MESLTSLAGAKTSADFSPRMAVFCPMKVNEVDLAIHLGSTPDRNQS